VPTFILPLGVVLLTIGLVALAATDDALVLISAPILSTVAVLLSATIFILPGRRPAMSDESRQDTEQP
jgi:hypothetical protein